MPDLRIKFRGPDLERALEILANSYPGLHGADGEPITLDDPIPMDGFEAVTVGELLESFKDSDERMPPEVYVSTVQESIPETDFDGTWGCVARWLLRELQNPTKPE
jgi:hypothetical protein